MPRKRIIGVAPPHKKRREAASDAVSRFSRLYFVYNKKNINHFLVCNMKFSLSGRYYSGENLRLISDQTSLY